MDLEGFARADPRSHAPLARDIAGAAVNARRWRHWRCLYAAIAGSACGMASAVAHDVDLVQHPTRLTDH
jgi:hypothetical protein